MCVIEEEWNRIEEGQTEMRQTVLVRLFFISCRFSQQEQISVALNIYAFNFPHQGSS